MATPRLNPLNSTTATLELENVPAVPNNVVSPTVTATLTRVDDFAVGFTLCDGSTVDVKLSDAEKNQIKVLYLQITGGDDSKVIDLQELDDKDQVVKDLKKLVANVKTLSNPSFEWSRRPVDARGDMNGPEPYTQNASTLQNLQWKTLVTVDQQKARSLIQKWDDALTSKKNELDLLFKSNPKQKHLKEDSETISKMLRKLRNQRLKFAVDFEMSAPVYRIPFQGIDLKDLHQHIEARKDLALQIIRDQYSGLRNLKVKVVGNADQWAETDFAYDLALQGISNDTVAGQPRLAGQTPRRQTYNEACGLIDISPKQDTLEFSVIEAAKVLADGRALHPDDLRTQPLIDFFNSLDVQARTDLQKEFIKP